jgi:hypothetical protein
MSSFHQADTLPEQAGSDTSGEMEAATVVLPRLTTDKIPTTQSRESNVRFLNYFLEQNRGEVRAYIPGVGGYKVTRFIAMQDTNWIMISVKDVILDAIIEVVVPWYTQFAITLARA